ncbi:spore germination protein (amino acid permease) [Bacillus sp. OV322]|uniref:GerAB/ArcD/ProY family transporter n=1 Tax=Bacillus sp. OV322 TaxID=1882764 RepID=UPI0008F42C0E|nr:GerAB/ArcD/ProY family transporter [Bacillus sp. OV322]SFC79519.1 spore germination protein (amino acid permease) [Bacillus sp. OV322]
MKEKLHHIHLVIFIYSIQFGVTIFSLPGMLAREFGSNGWIAIFLIFFVVVLGILLIGACYNLSDGDFLNSLENSLPRFLSSFLFLLLAVVWSLYGCVIGKQYIMIFQMITFPTTSPMLLKLGLVVLTYLLVIKDLYNISKISTIIFFITIWMLILLIYPFQEMDLSRYTPFFFKDGGHWIRGSISVFAAFLGYELSLLFFPFVNKESKFVRSLILGNLLTTIIYGIVCVVCYGFFGYSYLKVLLFPFMDLLSNVELPFVQRIENLLFALFFFKVLITVVMYFWGAKECAKRVFKKTSEKRISLIIVALTYIVSFYFQTMEDVNGWLIRLSNIEAAVSFLLPLLGIALLLYRRKRKYYG